MFQNILFCTDFSEDSHWAFTYALDLARTYKAKLLIFHVTPRPFILSSSRFISPRKNWMNCGSARRRKWIDR